MKSSVDEIRRRFDLDVERFANLETGQQAAVDSAYAMDLIAAAAAATTPSARAVLDVGCGAGNYALKLLERLPGLDVTLVDLSRPMLDRATERIRNARSGKISALQGDIRELELGEARFDVILAAAVLHHLRSRNEWETVLAALHRALTPGGSLWVYDMVESDLPEIQSLMRDRYAAYLRELGGDDYQRRVFSDIEMEDTPRSLMYQLDLLRTVGFGAVEILHKNACFAAFGAVKRR